MQRRQFLRHAGVAAAAASTAVVAGCASEQARPVPGPSPRTPPSLSMAPDSLELAPIRAQADRITGVYVCTRPFRAAGPRIETERLGHKTLVHNYGHGGSGWSLSWGSGALALRMVQATGVHQLGVIGCGALGLTSALLAQRAGLSVRIYAKALPPDVFSMRASGLWTPDSRICDAAHAPALTARWDDLASTSFAMYQSLLGLPGRPIEWIDGYALQDAPFTGNAERIPDEPEYGSFDTRFTPHSVDLAPGSYPFPQAHARRYTTLMFNLSSYVRMLMADFRAAGGQIEVREFKHPRELLALPETTLINATGYGAKALFGDDSIIPVRGQTARLIPQPEVTYALSTDNVSVVPRSDGLLVQAFGDTGNFNNSDLTPDRAASEAAVARVAKLFAHTRRG